MPNKLISNSVSQFKIKVHDNNQEKYLFKSRNLVLPLASQFTK